MRARKAARTDRAGKKVLHRGPTRENRPRSLAAIERDLARMRKRADAANGLFMGFVKRVNALAAERDSHPDTLAVKRPEVRLNEEALAYLLAQPEPELGAVLSRIANDLELARAVVQTAWQAIQGADIGELDGLDDVLQRHADDEIVDCVQRLRDAVAGARLKGDQMVVTQPKAEDGEAS